MPDISLEDLSDPYAGPSAADWNPEGVVIHRGLIPDTLIESYEDEWRRNNGFRRFVYPPGHPAEGQTMIGDHPSSHQLATIEADNAGGYNETAYMRNEALFKICTYAPLAAALESAVGEPMGVHLNLSGWVSTKRDWHQDTYLNPEHVGDYYAAVWVALGDVHPDSGPFEYVPGSHLWHTLKQAKVLKYVDGSDPRWPQYTEEILTPLVEKEIAERGVDRVVHLPKKGDVLIWHGRLYHRGTVPNVEGAYRPALIAHYSGIHHRKDMPKAVKSENGGWYFPIRHQGDLAHAMMSKP